MNDRLESTLTGLYAIGAARIGHGGMLADAVADARLAIDQVLRRRGAAQAR